MTDSLCTNCGSHKLGCLCPCPKCGCEPIDADINIMLSDHNLHEEEMNNISLAIQEIYKTKYDEETRVQILLYFLSRKWPRLIQYNIDEVEYDLQENLDRFYREKLSKIPGQISSNQKISPIIDSYWDKATSPEYRKVEDEWKEQVSPLLLSGIDIAQNLFYLRDKAGEGAVFQKIKFFYRHIFVSCDYNAILTELEFCIGDIKEYQRNINRFCSKIKNGWSNQTKQRAAYFRGLCQRLLEMANYTKIIIEYKAGIRTMIKMDIKRNRQEFLNVYLIFHDLLKVVLDPAEIEPTDFFDE